MIKRELSVERLSGEFEDEHYDLAIACAGYETRSRYFFDKHSTVAKVKKAAAFDKQQVLAFHENINWFSDNEFQTEVVPDSEYPNWLEGAVMRALPPSDGVFRVIADVSSLSRTRIAYLISTFLGLSGHFEIVLDLVYSLAAFSVPIEQESPNSHVGPVTAEFAGWWTDPDRPLSAVVGLGYEQDKALGAVEYLQAQDIWIFQPVSVVEEYTSALSSANQGLMAVTQPAQRFTYAVEDPLACYATLQSLLQGLVSNSNVVLLPFGPKLFAVCCLLVASSMDQVAVWRVSAQQDETPVDRKPKGESYCLRVVLSALPALNV